MRAIIADRGRQRAEQRVGASLRISELSERVRSAWCDGRRGQSVASSGRVARADLGACLRQARFLQGGLIAGRAWHAKRYVLRIAQQRRPVPCVPLPKAFAQGFTQGICRRRGKREQHASGENEKFPAAGYHDIIRLLRSGTELLQDRHVYAAQFATRGARHITDGRDICFFLF